MKIELNIKSDTCNSYPDDGLIIEVLDNTDEIYIYIEDREISVNKEEFIRMTKVLR